MLENDVPTLIINYGKPIDRMKLRKHTFAIGGKELLREDDLCVYVYLLYVDIWVWYNSF